MRQVATVYSVHCTILRNGPLMRNPQNYGTVYGVRYSGENVTGQQAHIGSALAAKKEGRMQVFAG